MAERRQVFRREGIELDFGDGKEAVAHPLPWQVRDDFGDTVVKEYITSLNDSLKAVRDESGDITGFTGKLREVTIDFPKLLSVGYPHVPESFWTPLTSEQMLEALKVSLEVNKLERIIYMIDPNFAAQETESEEATETQKTTSSEDS